MDSGDRQTGKSGGGGPCGGGIKRNANCPAEQFHWPKIGSKMVPKGLGTKHFVKKRARSGVGE